MTEEQKGEIRHMHSHHGLGFRGLRIVGLVIAGVIFAGAFALIFGWLVMILWNWIMPPIFHLGEIGYWQGFGILLLAKIIFGAVGGRTPGVRHGRPPWRGAPWARDHWHEDNEWWRYAHDFWKEEGKEAFYRFVDRKKAQPAASKSTSPEGNKV
jgi:hypothetical protein